MEGDPMQGTYIPKSSEDAARVADLVEAAVISAPTQDERDRLLRIASAYWELANH